jgi:hypothetical protein
MSVAEDSGAYSAAWATEISSGLGESDTLAFTVECASGASLFADAPAIGATGHLTFRTTANMYGTASCTVTLTEQMSGGLSVSAPLNIEVTAGELQTL